MSGGWSGGREGESAKEVEWFGWRGDLGVALMVMDDVSFHVLRKRASVERRVDGVVWLCWLRHLRCASGTRPARDLDRHPRLASGNCHRWIGPWWNQTLPTQIRRSLNRKRRWRVGLRAT